MLIMMRKDSTEEQCHSVEEAIRRMGYTPLPVPGVNRIAICVTGNRGPVEPAYLAQLPGVLECIPVTKPYKLVSREVHPEDSIVTIEDVNFGGKEPVLVAGPCSVETEARTIEVARQVRDAGAQLFRAGAFKPRTSPYSFQGLGTEGLVTLRRVREEVGIPVVSEALDTELVEVVAEHVDLVQVGARNMQNFSLLRKLAKIGKPVLLKRGVAATLDEWLMAAEYLLAGGNHQVILCERGIRTFNNHSRNTLDLNVVPAIRRISHLPILVDPSHGVGRRERVRPLARAAIAAGAQGLLIEAHTRPETAYSDARQTIDLETLRGIVSDTELLQKLEPLFDFDVAEYSGSESLTN
jgi:3-deoxy-7-phosphoheptulonate synthase